MTFKSFSLLWASWPSCLALLRVIIPQNSSHSAEQRVKKEEQLNFIKRLMKIWFFILDEPASSITRRARRRCSHAVRVQNFWHERWAVNVYLMFLWRKWHSAVFIVVLKHPLRCFSKPVQRTVISLGLARLNNLIMMWTTAGNSKQDLYTYIKTSMAST